MSRSTGRAPSVSLSTLRQILTRYQDEDQPSVAQLAEEFSLCQATVRKYLRLALGSLPRGRAALLPRPKQDVETLLNRVPTEELLGEGRMELLHRRLQEGVSLSAIAEELGLTRHRVTRVRDRLLAEA